MTVWSRSPSVGVLLLRSVSALLSYFGLLMAMCSARTCDKWQISNSHVSLIDLRISEKKGGWHHLYCVPALFAVSVSLQCWTRFRLRVLFGVQSYLWGWVLDQHWRTTHVSHATGMWWCSANHRDKWKMGCPCGDFVPRRNESIKLESYLLTALVISTCSLESV